MRGDIEVKVSYFGSRECDCTIGTVSDQGRLEKLSTERVVWDTEGWRECKRCPDSRWRNIRDCFGRGLRMQGWKVSGTRTVGG